MTCEYVFQPLDLLHVVDFVSNESLQPFIYTCGFKQKAQFVLLPAIAAFTKHSLAKNVNEIQRLKSR